MELGGDLNTVHVYLSDAALQATADGGWPVRLKLEFGTTDPLLEQLVLALDGVVRRWEPAPAPTRISSALIAAQLARRHSVRQRIDEPWPGPGKWGLTDRQFAAVRELIGRPPVRSRCRWRTSPRPRASASASSPGVQGPHGVPPHRYLMRLRRRTGRSPAAGGNHAHRRGGGPMCGFSHQEHLTRVIRSHLGTTPAALRREG